MEKKSRVRHVRSRNVGNALPRKKTHSPFKSKKKSVWKSGKERILYRILGGAILLLAIGGFIFWNMFLRWIPSINALATGNYFRESTVIYDNQGNAIYTLFKDGKRTYVNYDQISQSIKDAIVATEDRTFFENPGIDFMGIVRTSLSHITGGKIWWRAGGASTISQQLIKNTLLTNEFTIKRKVQEAVLSYQMNQKYSKEKILEMYLNAFSFGYNANGIEEASRTYFGKSAKDVGPLGSSILASLPLAPTKYSPYNNRERLMGKVEIYPSNNRSQKKILITHNDKKQYAPLYDEFKSYLSGMTMTRQNTTLQACNVRQEYIKDNKFQVNTDWCIELDFRDVVNFVGHIAISKDISIDNANSKYTIEYTVWRKDLVGSFMLEEGKIDGETFKNIVFHGLEFEFRKYTENIKYPYFVMFVKEYLESKYGKDIDVTSGLRVYTTLDPKLQGFAENVVKKQSTINAKKYWAKSASLVSMDNVNGKLLAMVGGPDYFDTNNGGNNNMTTALRQPWSSFKPLVYSLAIAKNPIWPASPVADEPTKFGKWSPNNYDKKFQWLMTLQNALGHSRNIPAAKMYYLAGQEEELIKYGRTLGLTTLRDNASYGAPMSLGTAEIKSIDMMQAFSVIANNGQKKDIYFIEKIEDTDGNIIEQHKDAASKEVVSPAASYIVSTILSDKSSQPDGFWRNTLSIAGKKVAAKTWTSNKEFRKWNRKIILPWDLWTVGFTPQITTVVWAGNVDGSAAKSNCSGLSCAAPIWKEFMVFALKDLPYEDFKKPKGVHNVTISKLTGLLATKDTPENLRQKTIMAVKSDRYDEWVISTEVDVLCGWPVGPDTPPDAIVKFHKPSWKPVIDGYDPNWLKGFYKASGTSTLSWVTLSSEPCFRPKDAGNVILSVSPQWKTLIVKWDGNRIIQKLIVVEWGNIIDTIDLGENGSKNGTKNIKVNDINTVQIKAIDVYGYRYAAWMPNQQLPETNLPTPINIWNNNGDAPAPNITVTNPKWSNITLYAGDMFNLRFHTKIGTTVREIDVSLNGKTIQSATTGEVFIFPVSSAWLDVWRHTITITAKDANMKVAVKNFTLTILSR